MTIVRNVLAVILGFIIGSAVNMGLIVLGSLLLPAPDGVDISSSESLAASIHLFELKHFVFPFLGHAAGTFAGALAAWFIAATHKAVLTGSVGALFFLGGIANTVMIPAPTWFIAADLILAYWPMTGLAVLLANQLSGPAPGRDT